ncbi:MAG: ERCC4 domain-containing protein, partial [Planctomycetes bacterium]|nr:ERCC4 domain-containing protein [Planctomycetota bacterium]
VERKNLGDLVACCTCWRPRFEKELERMATTTKIPVMLVEADLGDVLHHRYRSATAPASIIGSLSAWTLDYGVRTWWAGSPMGGATMLVRFFAAIARRVERGELAAG